MTKQFKRYCVDNWTHPQTDTTENNITFTTLLLHSDTHSNITVRTESHDISTLLSTLHRLVDRPTVATLFRLCTNVASQL